MLRSGEKWRNLVGLEYEDYFDKDEFRHMLLAGGIENISAIFHLGACSSTTETDADYLMENNYRYTRDMCEWSLRNGVRFIYASSAATYGGGENGYSDSIEASMLLKPLNMYGYSKQAFDLWAIKHKLFDEIVGIKFFNVYGPYEAHKVHMRSMINKAYGQIMETGRLCLFKSYHPDYEDGMQKRDFVYVKDAVEMMLFFFDRSEVSGLYNCGMGKARTWVDLANSVFAALNKPAVIEYVEMPEKLKGKYQYFTEADMGKAAKAGFNHEFYSLEDGVKDYVQNYLQKGIL
jgi:ADP-L-glycero-D-manno-heptose 6-epimerase